MKVQIYNNEGLIDEIKAVFRKDHACISIRLCGGEPNSEYIVRRGTRDSNPLILISNKTPANSKVMWEYLNSLLVNDVERCEEIIKSTNFTELVLTPETELECDIFGRKRGGLSGFSFSFDDRWITWYWVDLEEDDMGTIWKDVEAPTIEELKSW